MKKTLGISILILATITLSAQSRLSVKAADTLDFILYMNDVQVNNLPVLSLTLDNVPSGKISLKATVPTQPALAVSQQLTLKKNTSVFYELEMSKGAYKFVLKSESTVVIAEATVPVATVPATNTPATTNVAATNGNTSPALVLDETTTLEIIDEDGCLHLVDPDIYDKMIDDVNAALFETKKLELMKAFLVHHCIRTEQLRFMMSRLSLEDSKIALLKASMDHIYDEKNLENAANDFLLEKNRARANQVIEQRP